MTLVRYNPVKNLTRWNPNMDEMFDTFFGEGNMKSCESGINPRVDIIEETDKVRMEMELPGLGKDEIKVKVENGVLSISGERTHEKKDEKANYVRCERRHGSFLRSFTLGDEIDSENIKADYTNGVLHLSLPKTEKSLPKEISVEVN